MESWAVSHCSVLNQPIQQRIRKLPTLMSPPLWHPVQRGRYVICSLSLSDLVRSTSVRTAQYRASRVRVASPSVMRGFIQGSVVVLSITCSLSFRQPVDTVTRRPRLVLLSVRLPVLVLVLTITTSERIDTLISHNLTGPAEKHRAGAWWRPVLAHSAVPLASPAHP